MRIYLIRHTTPLVEKGICYGQTDLDVTESFDEEVKMIRPHLPLTDIEVYSSPLKRCKKLAHSLYQDLDIKCYDDLMELNCGDWEMQKWDDIPSHEIDPWMNDFIHQFVPNGESYLSMHQRVVNRYEAIKETGKNAVIVAHGGVLRSILAHITQTPLKEAFDLFTLHYGCVVEISMEDNDPKHTILYNHSREGKEWHRPTKN